LRLSFAELTDDTVVYEYAVLVTSLPGEILTIAQLLRDRADSENPFDELKNPWGWGGFTTQDLKRCRFMARITALTYNGWSLFVRLADPRQHTEAITSRPLLLHAPARLTRHGGQTRITISHPHADAAWVENACREIAAFFKTLRPTAEPLTPLQRWYHVLARPGEVPQWPRIAPATGFTGPGIAGISSPRVPGGGLETARDGLVLRFLGRRTPNHSGRA